MNEGGAATVGLTQVMAMTGLSRAELGRLIDAGRFPRPLPLGPWATGWRADEVRQWLEARQPA